MPWCATEVDENLNIITWSLCYAELGMYNCIAILDGKPNY